MPNDPLALPQILAELPDEAGYDAVHAAIMATERGRRFLTEYADRNRHADTAAIVSAIARIEATLRGEGPPRADATGDLMVIAAAIDRIEAALAAGAAPAPDVSAAIERAFGHRLRAARTPGRSDVVRRARCRHSRNFRRRHALGIDG